MRWVVALLALLTLVFSARLSAVPSRVWNDWWGGDTDEVLSIPVTGNDSVGEIGSTVCLVGGVPPAVPPNPPDCTGALSPAGAGTLTAPAVDDVGGYYVFTPSPGWKGTATFSYRAFESPGLLGDSADARVTIVVSDPVTVIRENGTGDVALYGVWERAVTNANGYGNPFDFREIELRGTFTAPSGAETEFFGFYDGDGSGGATGDVWKIRFMPTEVGTYTYLLSFSDSTPIPGAAGSFEVVDTGLPGPPSLLGGATPQSYHLQDARGAPIPWRGYSLFGINKWVVITVAEEVYYYRGIIEDQLLDVGGYNATMLSEGRDWFNDFIQTPASGGFELDRLTKADRVIDMLAAHRIWAVNWTCYIGNQSLWSEFFAGQDVSFPADPDRFRPVVRHFAARYAPFYNYFGWAPSWETWQTHDGINPDGSGKTEAVALYLEAISPWAKLPAAHDRANATWSGWQRIQLRQQQSDAIGDGNTRTADVVGGHDYVIAGAEDIWERSSGSLGQPSDGAEVRHAIWGELLAGVLTLYYEWNSFGHWPLAGPGNGEGEVFNKIAMDSWYGQTTWYNHTIQNALVGSDTANARASGWPGQEYAICDQNGGANSLDLSAEAAELSFELQWLDPLTGALSAGGFVNGGQVVNLNPPAPVAAEWCAFLHFSCLGDGATGDSDGDGWCDDVDLCPGFDDSVDADADGVPDGCDACPGFDDTLDADGDGVPDGCDVCPGFDDALDTDADGLPDGCDICPADYDPGQRDSDGNGIGDACQSYPVPAAADWVDYGDILLPGALGEWDFQLFGGLAGSVVKRAGTWHLYYQGACCYRIVDDSVTFRQVGVATSPDGVNFTKAGGNPVVEWSPNSGPEEGAASAAAVLDPSSGDVVLYYGANTEAGPTTVNADGRWTLSSDGVVFSDQGVVLDWTDPSVWGSGDELFPLIAIEEAGDWYLYYTPNGTPESRKLGVAWGSARDQLPDTAPALSGGSNVAAWGMGGAAKTASGTWTLFLSDLTPRRIQARTVSLGSPAQLSAPVATYQFAGHRQGAVLLDKQTNTWFLYYQHQDPPTTRFGLMLAPAGTPDATPPPPPPNVSATPQSHDEVLVSWDPASDPETGVVHYKVFRDDVELATVKGWSYTDRGLSELTGYAYQVAAVNYHGAEGARSPPAPATTPADTTPPALASVSGSGSPTQVEVVFDEPVEQASAETAANYTIDNGIAVTAASLGGDLRTVTLTTTHQTAHVTYQLSVDGIVDRAASPNTLAGPLARSYSFTAAAGLAGCWRLEDGAGLSAADTGNFGHDGSLDYPGKTPATWTAGIRGGALEFDGVNDHVIIGGLGTLESATDASHTFAAWARPDTAPPGSQFYNQLSSILTRSYTGLYYDFNQRFKAIIRQSNGTEVSVSSAVLAPGSWHHVAMVVDAASLELRLYVDGLEVGGSPVSYVGGVEDLGTADYLLGASDSLEERYDYRWDGLLDEAKVFARALTAPEIAALALDPADDADADGVADATDNCPATANPDQSDSDADGNGDVCDLCPGFDDSVDTDADGVPDGCDLCAGFDDAIDADADGIPDGCDICPGSDDGIDSDLDGVPDGCDLCPGSDDGIDSDLDGVPDGCDLCPGFDDAIDTDADGVPDGCDVCAGFDDTVDTDADGVPDGCDTCSGFDDAIDVDGDGVSDGCDLQVIVDASNIESRDSFFACGELRVVAATVTASRSVELTAETVVLGQGLSVLGSLTAFNRPCTLPP